MLLNLYRRALYRQFLEQAKLFNEFYLWQQGETFDQWTQREFGNLRTIESKEKVSVDVYKLKQIITTSIKDLFGEAGVTNQVDILKYQEKEGKIILRKEGKDVIIFATADNHKEPSKVKLPDPEPQAGLILPNGEINWNCPCLGGMATGPCGVEFREAFSCFHNSEADPKGSDCYNAFKEMHLCLAEYPQLYKNYNDDDEDDLDINLTDAEKALISEDNINENTDKDKVSSVPKVEEKPTEKKPDVRTEPKSSTKTSPATSTIKINT